MVGGPARRRGPLEGATGRRLARPVLTVELDSGRRKRVVAMPGGHMGAAGESWHASFNWPGDPAEIIGAELELGRNVVVELPLPDRKRRRRRRHAVAEAQEQSSVTRSCGSRPARCAPRSTGCGPSWPGASAS